jgi:hypothetical protein
MDALVDPARRVDTYVADERDYDAYVSKRAASRKRAEFFAVYRRQLTYFITQALIFVAALAWSSAMMALFAYAIPSSERQQMGAKFVYALVLTLFSVYVIYLLAKNTPQNPLQGLAD